MKLPEILFDPRFWIAFWVTLAALLVATFVEAIRVDREIQRQRDEAA